MGVVSAITAVWTEVMEWIATAMTSVIDIFYVAESGLTFIGVLTVVALAISIFFLLLNVISNFLNLRQ